MSIDRGNAEPRRAAQSTSRQEIDSLNHESIIDPGRAEIKGESDDRELERNRDKEHEPLHLGRSRRFQLRARLGSP